MEVSSIFYVKFSTFTHLEQSTITLFTVNKSGIIMLTVHHEIIVNISFMCYPGDYLRQTSADVLSLELHPLDLRQLGNFSGCTPQLSYRQYQTY
jgi:hypothetical protein